MENIRKIKKYIEKYQNIHLLMSPDLKKDSCPACLALFYSLKNLGKNATLLNKTCSEKYRFLVEKEKTHPQQADFLISIKEAGTKLSKLFYEKTDQGLNLFLKTDGELRKENISFRPLHEENLLITIGVENLKEVQKFLIGKSYTALNIDNSLKNEEFAELNFIQPEKTLSEIVFDIISHIDENLFTPSVTTCLLAGLIEQATKADKLSQASLKIIDTMIEKGADLKKVSSSLFSDNSLRILSKILGKIKAEKETGFILLKESDFTETDSSPNNLALTFQKLASGFFPFQDLVCLWEQNSSPLLIRGVFYSENEDKLNNILSTFEGQQKGKGVLFETHKTDLRLAKNKIINLL